MILSLFFRIMRFYLVLIINSIDLYIMFMLIIFRIINNIINFIETCFQLR